MLTFLTVVSYYLKKESDLFYAIPNNNLEIAQKIIKENPSHVNSIICKTPLHLAVKTYNRDIVKLLLDNGADVHRKDHLGNQPVHYAALSNALSLSQYQESNRFIDGLPIIKLLVENGADIKERGYNRLTPLHVSSLNGDYNLDALKYILECFKNPKERLECINAEDVEGKNITLIYATYSGAIKMIEYLLESGANPFFYLIDMDKNYTKYHHIIGFLTEEGSSSSRLCKLVNKLCREDYKETSGKIINILNRCFDKETGKNFFASCPVNELRIIFESVNIDDDTKKEIVYYGGNALQELLKDQMDRFQCSNDVKQYFNSVCINHDMLTLKNIAVSCIRKYLENPANIDQLPLPPSLKNFVANKVIQVFNNPSRSTGL